MGEKEKICSDIMNYIKLQKIIVADEFNEHRYNPIKRYDLLGQNKALDGLEVFLKLYCAKVGEDVML